MLRNDPLSARPLDNPYISAREVADSATCNAQGRNQQWWEALPMTYAGWSATERSLSTNEQFETLRGLFLDGNPWLRHQFDFNAYKDRAVLEIGCGTGVAASLLAAAGADVTAIDITEKAASTARRCAQHFKLPVKILRMDAERLDFADESFDFVFSWGVIHHSARPENIAREIYRVLRPGGAGLVMVYNRKSLRYYVRGLQWLLLRGKLFQGFSLASVQQFFTDGYYHRHFSPAELRSFFSAAHLAVTQIFVTHMGKNWCRFCRNPGMGA